VPVIKQLKMNQLIKDILQKSILVKQEIINDPVLQETIMTVAGEMVKCFRNGGKVLFCGNGGSAADAQHLAAELSGRYYYDRDPLPAEALHVNTSFLTAVANDYSFDEVYARMVKGNGQKGDILVGFSTSGNSANIIRAFEQALQSGMTTVGFTGKSGGKLKEHCCYLVNVPSSDTPRIQESHITIGHIICQIVESELFPREK
jgi:D-sedoheptulose 7-phosphate isomerase